MRKITRKALLLLSMTILSMSLGLAQGAGTIEPQAITEETSTITLKTVRALFPDQPVAVANELFGGLHSVADTAELHSAIGSPLDTAELQIGMMVYVQSANMYYRYKGADGDGLNHHTQQSPDTIVDVFDANGVNLNYWESLVDLIANVSANNVFNRAANDTSTATYPFIEGDVYITPDTTFVWDGLGWTPMALNELDSVATHRDSIGDPVSGDIAVEIDTTWIYADSTWIAMSTNGVDVINDTTGMSAFSEGDIYLDDDSTFVWDGNEWSMLALSVSDSVRTGHRDSIPDSTRIVGDLINNNDSVFVWDGDSWELISILPTASVDSFYVFYSVDGGVTIDTIGADTATVLSADMDNFREQVSTIPALRQFTGTGSNGVHIYYPAAWGEFFYSILYGGSTKISLTNGVSVSTAGLTFGGTTVDVPYKDVRIHSRSQIVEID